MNGGSLPANCLEAAGPDPAMFYRLDELAKLASELGLRWRRVDENRLDVNVTPDAVLAFCNLVDEDDTLVGFDGTSWHSHGIVHFMTGTSTHIECDELDILIGLGTGDLSVVSQYVRGELKDHWLAHKDEPLSVKYIQPGEELRIQRLDKRG